VKALPQIVYFQTATRCEGHCWHCPFDDVYVKGEMPRSEMDFDGYAAVIQWLSGKDYKGRLGFLLHYEPATDARLPRFIEYAKAALPGAKVEIATNCGDDGPVAFKMADVVQRERTNTLTTRAGNVSDPGLRIGRGRLCEPPCWLPEETMCVAASGELLLCCQDWRHEAVCGTWDDLDGARARQLDLSEKAKRQELEICRDCMAGKTAEEVGSRLGRRKP
jgi:hypothetical protein